MNSTLKLVSIPLSMTDVQKAPSIYATETSEFLQNIYAPTSVSIGPDSSPTRELREELESSLRAKYDDDTETESEGDDWQLHRELHLSIVPWEEFQPAPKRLRLGTIHPQAGGYRYIDIDYQGEPFLLRLPPLVPDGGLEYYDEYRPSAPPEHPYLVGRLLLQGQRERTKDPSYRQIYCQVRRFGLAVCQLLQKRWPERRVSLYAETKIDEGLAALLLYRHCPPGDGCRPDPEEVVIKRAAQRDVWRPETYAALQRALVRATGLEAIVRVYVTIYERGSVVIVDPYLLIRELSLLSEGMLPPFQQS